MKRMKSGTVIGLVLVLAALAALVSALVSRASMERYLDDGPPASESR